jgi:hypothetical protein
LSIVAGNRDDSDKVKKATTPEKDKGSETKPEEPKK